MKSPFKLLDAYTSEDRNVFWGREKETAELYSMVNRNRLILVYGQSGTGKTSLIQSGLANCFDITDWYQILIRRNSNLIESLHVALEKAAGLEGNITEQLKVIYEHNLRPIYLIFDQLEELLILGSSEEQNNFITTIKSALDAKTPCRILFVIREEYLAHLYAFERVIPTLFDIRLRIEPMNRVNVKHVLEQSFSHYQIEIEGEHDAFFEQIIDNVSAEKSGIALPYLQVYLDLLYRKNLKTATNGAQGMMPTMRLSKENVAQLGKIDNVLLQFLTEQQRSIQQHLSKEHQDIDPQFIQKVLDVFVTEEGTKRPIAFSRTAQGIEIEPKVKILIPPATPQLLEDCFVSLEQARLLRFTDTHVELAHDSLAALIDSKRTDEQRNLNETYNRLLYRYEEFQKTGELLSRKQITLLEDFLPFISNRLEMPVLDFIENSELTVEKAEKAELEAEKVKRRQNFWFAIGGFGLFALSIVALIIAIIQYQIAERVKREIATRSWEASFNSARALKMDGKYPEAIQLIQQTTNLKDAIPDKLRDSTDNALLKWNKINQLMQRADSLTQQGAFLETLQMYEAAQKIDGDARIHTLKLQTQDRIDQSFNEFNFRGDAMVAAKKNDLAKIQYKKALELKPGAAIIQQKLDHLK